jgi:hypothetical protein
VGKIILQTCFHFHSPPPFLWYCGLNPGSW